MASLVYLFVLSQIALCLCHAAHPHHVRERESGLKEMSNILKDLEQVLFFDRRAAFSSDMQSYVNCMIGSFKQALLQLGLSIDPFDMGFDVSNFNLGFLKGFAQLNDLQLRGITNITVPQATVTPSVLPLGSRIQGQILWPTINMTSDYDGNMTLLGRPLNATGNSTGELSALGVNINALIPRNTLMPRVQSLSIIPSLQKSDFKFGGLKFNDLDLDQGMSSLFSNLAQFINSNANLFDQFVSPFIEDFINSRLSTRFTQDAMNFGILGNLGPNSGSSRCQLSMPMFP